MLWICYGVLGCSGFDCVFVICCGMWFGIFEVLVFLVLLLVHCVFWCFACFLWCFCLGF